MLRLLSVRRLSTPISSVSPISSLYQSVLADEQAFPKLQKFMTFCDQMERLAKFDEKLKEHNFRRDHELRTCTFSTREPVKSVLAVYINYRQEVSSEHAVACLEWLADVLYTRGENFYSDLSLLELYDDWRFLRIIDDLRTSLKPGMFLPPSHAGRVMRALGQIGYKDSGLFKLIEERAFSKSTESFNYCPAGNHIYTGFESHPDFQSYVQTLLEWKKKPSLPFVHLEKALELAHQSHSFTKELAAALLNVSSQYYEMIKAQREKAIFQNDSEVDNGLIELQETLVRAGLMHPDDFDNLDNFIDMDLKMKRAERIFYTLQRTFPYINSQKAKSFVEAGPKIGTDAIEFGEEKDIPSGNEFNAYNVGMFAEGAAEWMSGVEKDRDGGDYPNEFWRKKGTGFLDEMIPEAIERSTLTPHLTKMWQTGLSIFSKLLPIAKSAIPSGSTQDLCLVLYGMSRGRVIDLEFCRLIEETSPVGEVNTRERVKGLYGAALSGHNTKFAAMLFKNFPIEEVRDMDRRDLTRLTWSLAALGMEESKLFEACLKALNDGTLINKQLTREMSELSHDLVQFLYVSKNLPRELVPENFLEFFSLVNPSFFDPIKSLVLPAIRPLLGIALTPAEAKHYKAIIAPHIPQNYPVDDMLVLNQKLAPVMLMGTDGFSLNGEILIGYSRMREIILKANGYNPLFIPVHCLTDIDFSTGELRLNKSFSLKDWVASHFGEFSDYLTPLDSMMEATMEKLRVRELDGSGSNQEAFKVVKELMTLYKLQEALKLKTTPCEIAEKIEEMKLKIVKIDIEFNKLQGEDRNTFPDLPTLLRQSYDKLAQSPRVESPLPNYLKKWVGMRQAHEIPPQSDVKKDIDTELVNQPFLWVSNYFQYKDWEKLMMNSFPMHLDMLMEGNDYRNRTFFTGRRQIYGNTPNPAKSENVFGGHISTKSRIIASLTNIKYELKRTLSDSEIVEKVLNLELIEKLTEEHLGKNPNLQLKLLPRDPLEFVRMMDHVEYLKSDMDLFIKHYRRLHLKEVARDRLFTNHLLYLKQISASTSMTIMERSAARNAAIDKYMEEYRAASVDDSDFDYAFADGKKQRVATKTNPESLKPLERTIFEDEDFLSVSDDESYLQLKRLKAESKLIKASILRKLSKEQPLSKLQELYLESWKADLKSIKLTEVGRCFMPGHITSMTYKDIPLADKNFFNGLHNVKIPNNPNYCANDLILELSHFIDDEVVHRVEFLFAEANELKKWKGLYPEGNGKSKFKPDWVNKELRLRNLELEEHIWLNAGKMTEVDFKHFEDLYGFQRGKQRYDRIWWPLDLKSWKNFSAEANEYENRLDLMRVWYRRKEKQFKYHIPMGQFARPDNELHADYIKAKAIKGARALEAFTGMDCANLTDSFLKEIGVDIIKKMVGKQITSVKALWGVIYHPNASPRTKEELETVMKKYKLSENDGLEPLATMPVALNGDKLAPVRSPAEWEALITQAGGDYITPLLTQLSK